MAFDCGIDWNILIFIFEQLWKLIEAHKPHAMIGVIWILVVMISFDRYRFDTDMSHFESWAMLESIAKHTCCSELNLT
jgi:heme/copper-type cytochrome/quinol oxidase subunit 3